MRGRRGGQDAAPDTYRGVDDLIDAFDVGRDAGIAERLVMNDAKG